MMKQFRCIACLAVVLSVAVLPLGAQTMQTTFGKNRVQYHDDFDEWMMYESPNFITYWYGKGRNIGQAVVQLAEYDFYEIQGIIDHRINDKLEIIVYTDLTDLKQSNIGSEEAFENTTGQTKIQGNKIFVYFDGDHRHLRRQIREGIASVYLNSLLFGSNLQEIVQNAVLLNLPAWFKEGLIAFVGEKWSPELDDQLRDALLSGQYDDFDDLAEDNPRLAGHSLWYFISEHFGVPTVSNLLYLTRINRSVESGFLYVLGSTFSKTAESWKNYFTQRYKGELKMGVPPDEAFAIPVKNKRQLPLTQLKVSPDGKKIAYVLNEIGRYRVWVQDVTAGTRELVFHGGFRNAFQATDYNYPLLAWSPNGQELAILYESRDQLKLRRLNFYLDDEAEELMPEQYQRIYSMDYLSPNELVFTASVNGFSDIFLYFISTRQTQRITNDFWDDLDATVVHVRNRKGILFASNRPDSLKVDAPRLDTVLPIGHFDIFYYDLEGKPDEFVRVTHTPMADERQPIAIDTTWFGFLTDETGVVNRKTGYLETYLHHYDKVVRMRDRAELILHPDSSLTTVLDSAALENVDTVFLRPVYKERAVNHFASNYNRSIRLQHSAPRAGKVVEMMYIDLVPRLFLTPLQPELEIAPPMTLYRKRLEKDEAEKEARRSIAPAVVTPEVAESEPAPRAAPPAGRDTLPAPPADTLREEVATDYLFQSEFDDEDIPAPWETPADSLAKTPDFLPLEPDYQEPTYYPPVVALETAPNVHQVYEFQPGRIVPYRLKFRTEFVTTQLDNTQLFDGLNSYSGTPTDFGYPPPGILFKANFKDLFEDYQFEGGLRLPTSFNGTEYFATFDNRKQRLDKRYAFYRRALRFTGEPTPTALVPPKTESQIVLGQYQLRYPLDIFRSVRATASLRFDRTIQLATDATTLNTPTIREKRAGLRLEYVFDNTLDVALNIKNGSRYKVYAEMVKRFNVQLGQNPDFNFEKGFMTILGFDARHYQRVLKHSVLAGRLAGATSFGSEKILFFLGGTDGWLFQSFNQDIPQPFTTDFAYQTVSPHLRGFRYNIRNGNSFILTNVEFRLPLFRYLLPRTQSSFIRNFQLVGFFDGGTAWVGRSPYDKDSPLNTAIISNPQVTVRVNYFRDPFVYSYGVGVRTMVFGYFIRLDYGWGVETRVQQPPRLHVSMGLDF